MTTLTGVLVVSLAASAGPLAPVIAFAAVPVLLAGLMLYEQAFVRAGQLPPLS